MAGLFADDTWDQTGAVIDWCSYTYEWVGLREGASIRRRSSFEESIKRSIDPH